MRVLKIHQVTMSASLAVLLVLSSFQLSPVASYNLTMRPDHVRTSLRPESVSYTCTADAALTGCQFRWRNWDGVAGPLLDLSRGTLSQVNSTHLDTELAGYSYSGRGLGAGDCGVSLQVDGKKHWMVACRVRAETGGWTYAWADLSANSYELLPTTLTPRETVVLPGGEARLTLKAQEPLEVCCFYLPGIRLNFNTGAQSRHSTGRHRYLGGGLGDGECGLALSNVSEADNGLVLGWIINRPVTKKDSRFMALIVARPPGAPTLSVVYTDAGVTATCVVHEGRPLPSISWLLGDVVVRQDSLDDHPGNAQDKWRWPWMQGSVLQRLTLQAKDNGKVLKCVASHVTLAQPLEATELISFPSCPPLTSNTTSIACFTGGQEVNCTQPQLTGSSAELACKPGHTTAKNVTYRRISCTTSGEWNRPVFACHPDCGRRNTNQGEPLISGGETARVGEFPWHVAIYEKANDSYTQICGGSLISTRIVISAAHCFWSEQYTRKKESVYAVAAGKHKRAWLDAEDDDQVQRRQVEHITIHPRYHGRQSSFQADIALVRLSAPVDITASVNLVCVDWENLLEETQLQQGNNGTVPGMGYTEEGQLSTVVKHVDLPYIDYDTCFDVLDGPLKPLMALDKFCAGYANRSVSACRGDSGGGLVFLRKSSNRYYLRGLVSIAFKPASSNDLCYAQSYTAFTLVSNYLRWMRDHGLVQDSS